MSDKSRCYVSSGSRQSIVTGESEGGCSEFPPLMLRKSWTRGVPYRDSFDHARPTDSTGNRNKLSLTVAVFTWFGYSFRLISMRILYGRRALVYNWTCLGNCYTPATKTMRTIHMPPKRRPPPKLYGPLGPNGELQFPPLKPWAEREKERLDAIKKEQDKKKLPKGQVFTPCSL